MNIWENAVITTKGLALLAKLTAGNTLTLTKAIVGSGYVTPGLLVQQTTVTSPKQEISFRAQSYPEEGKCKLPCFLTNNDLNEGYTASQVGIYATDPDEGEILFFIAQAMSGKGTEIPSASEMPGYSSEWTFYFTYGQADGVSVTVDPVGPVFVVTFTTEDFETGTPDATYAEVVAAINAGKTCFVRIVSTNEDDSGIYMLPLVKYSPDSGTVVFSGAVIVSWSVVALYFKMDDYGDSWITSDIIDPNAFHYQDADSIRTGTFAGSVKANKYAQSAVETAQVRNIYAGTLDLTAGSSPLESGAVYFVYE